MARKKLISESLNYLLDDKLLSNASSGLKEEGYYIFNSLFKKEFCERVKNQINNFSNEDSVEINYKGTEHRIWKSHKKSKEIEQFFILSNHVY